MMGIIGGIIFVLGIFSLFNFGFSLIYILSSTAGNGFYRWITHDLDFMLILAAPFFGGLSGRQVVCMSDLIGLVLESYLYSTPF